MIDSVLFAVHESSSFELVLYGISAAAILLTTQLLIRCLIHPLRDVPGPLLARFTRLNEFQAQRGGDFAQEQIRLHEKYGELDARIVA